MIAKILIATTILIAIISIVFNISTYSRKYSKYLQFIALAPLIAIPIIFYMLGYIYIFNLVLVSIIIVSVLYLFTVNPRSLYFIAIIMILIGAAAYNVKHQFYEYSLAAGIFLLLIALVKDIIHERSN